MAQEVYESYQHLEQTLIIWIPPNAVPSATYAYSDPRLIQCYPQTLCPNIRLSSNTKGFIFLSHISLALNFVINPSVSLVFDASAEKEFQQFPIHWKIHSYGNLSFAPTPGGYPPYPIVVLNAEACTELFINDLFAGIHHISYAQNELCDITLSPLVNSIRQKVQKYIYDQTHQLYIRPLEIKLIEDINPKEYASLEAAPPTFTCIKERLPLIPLGNNYIFELGTQLFVDFKHIDKAVKPCYTIGKVPPDTFLTHFFYESVSNWGSVIIKPWQSWFIYSTQPLGTLTGTYVPWQTYYQPRYFIGTAILYNIYADGVENYEINTIQIPPVDCSPDPREEPVPHHLHRFDPTYPKLMFSFGLGSKLLYFDYPHFVIPKPAYYIESLYGLQFDENASPVSFRNLMSTLFVPFPHYHWIIRGYSKHIYNRYRFYHFIIDISTKDYELISYEEGELEDFLWERIILAPADYRFTKEDYAKYFQEGGKWKEYWIDYYVVEFFRRENPQIRRFFNFSCHEALFWNTSAFEKIARDYDIDFYQLYLQPKQLCSHGSGQKNDEIHSGDYVRPIETATTYYFAIPPPFQGVGYVITELAEPTAPPRVYGEAQFDLIKTVTNYQIGTNHYVLESLYNLQGSLIRYEIKPGLVIGWGDGYLLYDDNSAQVASPNPKLFKWNPFNWELIEKPNIWISERPQGYPEPVRLISLKRKLAFVPLLGLDAFNGSSIASWDFAGFDYPYLIAFTSSKNGVEGTLFYYTPFQLKPIKDLEINIQFVGFPYYFLNPLTSFNKFYTHTGWLIHNPPTLELIKPFDALIYLYNYEEPTIQKEAYIKPYEGFKSISLIKTQAIFANQKQELPFSNYPPISGAFSIRKVCHSEAQAIAYLFFETNWQNYLPTDFNYISNKFIYQYWNFQLIKVQGAWFWCFPFTAPLPFGYSY